VNTESNQSLRLSLAAFAAILIHTILALLIYWLDISFLETKEKTIPFKLVSADRSSQFSSSSLSAEENSRAAQEYLATLNQSQFKSDTQTKRDSSSKGSLSPNQNAVKKLSDKHTRLDSPAFRGSNPSTAIHGLQNIFSRDKQSLKPSQTKQVSSKELEQLSDYEILLLSALRKDSLYDPFHAVMNTHKRKEVAYTITLRLFPNGAIKNALIKEPSGIMKIDELALQAAYRASPFPTPPHEDIQKGYKYDIPFIIYQNKNISK
jgi:outer membrane biosynthesis protein TonB